MVKPGLVLNLDFFDWVRHRYALNGENPTESDFREFIAQVADEGFDTVHFRTSGVGKVCYPSKVMTPFDGEYRLESNSLAELIRQWDPLAVAVDACKKDDLICLVWITLFDSYCIGLEDTFFAGRPDLLMRSRDGQHALRGVPCYACDETREYRLREAREVSDYGVDGIFYSMHSHTCCNRMTGDPEGENIFGYNPEVVAAFYEKHGVDILTEDFDRFDLYMVQGDFLTEYLREVRDLLRPRGQKLYATFAWEKDGGVHGTGRTMVNIGYATGREAFPYEHMVGIHFDCEKWIGDDIVDGLAAQADYTDEIAKVRQRSGGGDFYVWIYCGFDPETIGDRQKAIHSIVERAAGENLAGCLFHEAMSFEMVPEMWQIVNQHKLEFSK
jgi:hypothetical protein